MSNPEIPTTNATFTLETFKEKLKEYGAAYARGANSRPAAAHQAVRAAAQIDGVSPDKAEEFWEEFQRASARVKGIEYKREDTHKTQVSKFKAFLRLGALPAVDGVAVFDRAVKIIREYSQMEDNPLKGTAYDNLLTVARKQCDNPQNEMDEDDIRRVITPEGKDEKKPIDKLIDAYKKVKGLHDKIPSAALEDAIYSLEQAIVEGGGEVPATSKKDKAVQAALKTLKDAGVNLTMASSTTQMK